MKRFALILAVLAVAASTLAADITVVVDTAVIVPVNCFPLTDDTDFKSRETGIAYNAAGMDLVWNFVTTAGVQSQTAVTPTTSGVYDWTHVGDGIYSMEIPASGGGSINNDTEGFGWFSGVATGVMPWRGPIIQFSPANIANSIVNGTDKLDVNAAELGGTSQTGRDVGASVLLSSGTGTGEVSLSSGKVLLQATQTGVTIPTVTTVTNQLTAAQVATGVWQDATSGDFTVANSIGKSLYTAGVVPGGSGGLLISGTNTGTTTFGAITSTGAFTISDGLIITASTTNRSAVSATGNGTGSGALFISGTGATGSGITAYGQATNGYGLQLIGTGSNAGLISTGGATGAGARFVGGGLSGNGISVTTTSGDAINLTGSGSGKYGLSTIGTAGGALFTAGDTGTGITVTGGTTSGDGIDVSTTDGHAVDLTAAGSGKVDLDGTLGMFTAATSEVTGVPSGAASLKDILRTLYQQAIYGGEVSASKKSIYDSGGAIEYEYDISDNGTTFIESAANAP